MLGLSLKIKFHIFLFKEKNVSISLRLNKQEDMFILENLKTQKNMTESGFWATGCNESKVNLKMKNG